MAGKVTGTLLGCDSVTCGLANCLETGIACGCIAAYRVWNCLPEQFWLWIHLVRIEPDWVS